MFFPKKNWVFYQKTIGESAMPLQYLAVLPNFQSLFHQTISKSPLPEGASSFPQISNFLGCPKPDFFFSSLPKLLPQTTARMLGLKLIWQSTT
jgi:hypothetical protein